MARNDFFPDFTFNPLRASKTRSKGQNLNSIPVHYLSSKAVLHPLLKNFRNYNNLNRSATNAENIELNGFSRWTTNPDLPNPRPNNTSESDSPTRNPFTEEISEPDDMPSVSGASTIIDDNPSIKPIAEEATSALVDAGEIADPLTDITNITTQVGSLALDQVNQQDATDLTNTGSAGNKLAAENIRQDSSAKTAGTIIGGDIGSLFGPIGSLAGATIGRALSGTTPRMMHSSSGDIDPSSYNANIY